MTKEELDFLIQQGEGYNLEYLLPHPIIEASDIYFGISFARPDLQKMSVEQRIKEYKNVPENVPENRPTLICQLMKNNRAITVLALAKKIRVNEKTIKRDIDNLKKDGSIRRIGPDKGGYWEVITASP